MAAPVKEIKNKFEKRSVSGREVFLQPWSLAQGYKQKDLEDQLCDIPGNHFFCSNLVYRYRAVLFKYYENSATKTPRRRLKGGGGWGLETLIFAFEYEKNHSIDILFCSL